MKKYIAFKPAAIIPVVLLCSLASCKPNFLLDPNPNSSIYSEKGSGGTRYYCYYEISNFSGLPCNLTVDPTVQKLTLVEPNPLVVAPDTKVKAKFEIVNFNPAAPCPAPCKVADLILKGTWAGYSDPAYFVEKTAALQWSAPITQTNCWVPAISLNADEKLFEAQLCTFIVPDAATGNQYHWDKVTEIYNPNDFTIKISVDDAAHHADPTKPPYHCYGHVITNGPSDLIWRDVPSYTSFNYGDTIKKNYTATCLAANKDAGIFLWQPDAKSTANNTLRRAIAIRVTVLP